ncbi:hypothetical protein HpBGD16_14690 [Helicobacter pylori]
MFDNNNYPIQTNQIQEISKDIFKAGSKNNNHEACSYVLYFSLKYDFEMEKTCHNMVLESNDCVLMCLGYLRARKDSKGFAIDKYLKRAETMIKLEDRTCILDDEFWLFAYEVLRVENENALKNCNGWSELLKKRVNMKVFALIINPIKILGKRIQAI